MTRPYHSPSSIAAGQRCEAYWAWTYVGGWRQPEVTWEQIEAGVPYQRGQRAPALGKAMHKVGEDWYTGGAPNWSSFPGQVFASGVQHLPHPAKCTWVQVEHSVGKEPSGVTGEDRPSTVLVVAGTRFAGFRDLAFASPEECTRLGIASEYGFVLVDYKSTSSIGRYAKTPADLIADPQCNLYALDLMYDLELDVMPTRWVYFETGATRRAKPVDVLVERANAERVLAELAPLARHLDTITDPERALCNPAACGDYGGCWLHASNGGPCNARRSIGALVQRKVNKIMPIDPEEAARVNHRFARAIATAQSIAPTPAAPAVTDAIDTSGIEVSPDAEPAPSVADAAPPPAVEPPAAPAPRPRGRPRLVRPAPAAPPSEPPVDAPPTPPAAPVQLPLPGVDAASETPAATVAVANVATGDVRVADLGDLIDGLRAVDADLKEAQITLVATQDRVQRLATARRKLAEAIQEACAV